MALRVEGIEGGEKEKVMQEEEREGKKEGKTREKKEERKEAKGRSGSTVKEHRLRVEEGERIEMVAERAKGFEPLVERPSKIFSRRGRVGHNKRVKWTTVSRLLEEQTTNSGKETKFCRLCGTTQSLQWRRGSDGTKSLCNGCGLHYLKMLQQERLIIDNPFPQPIAIRSLLN